MYIPSWLIILVLVVAIFLFIKQKKSTASKRDKHVINLVIEFNLETISDWLNKNGDIKDKKISKKDLDSNWGDVLKQSYYIDVLPSSEKRDIYFHRAKNVFTNIINGYDYFDNANEHIKRFIKKTKIKKLSWEFWRDYMALDVHFLNKKNSLVRTTILLIPLSEIAELQSNGEFKQLTDYSFEEEKISVPISFDSNNKPKKLIEIWRRRGGSGNWVAYSNALGSISATAPNHLCEEEY